MSRFTRIAALSAALSLCGASLATAALIAGTSMRSRFMAA